MRGEKQMQVYNILEQTNLYTSFERVNIEDADGDFVTEEDLEEMKELPGNDGWGNTIYHDNEIDIIVQEAVDKFKSRDSKRVTVLFKYDFGNWRVKDKFKDKLGEHNLRLIGDRIRLDERIVLSYNKTNAKKGLCQVIECYLVQVLEYDLKLARLHLKKNQEQAVDLSLKLGITFDQIIEFKDAKKGLKTDYDNIYYDCDFNDKDGRIFAINWYNETVKKLNETVDL